MVVVVVGVINGASAHSWESITVLLSFPQRRKMAISFSCSLHPSHVFPHRWRDRCGHSRWEEGRWVANVQQSDIVPCFRETELSRFTMGRLCGMGANIHRANNQSLVARRLMQGRQPATTRTITVGRRSTGLARGGEERRGQGLEEAKDRHGRTVSSREFGKKQPNPGSCQGL